MRPKSQMIVVHLVTSGGALVDSMQWIGLRLTRQLVKYEAAWKLHRGSLRLSATDIISKAGMNATDVISKADMYATKNLSQT